MMEKGRRPPLAPTKDEKQGERETCRRIPLPSILRSSPSVSAPPFMGPIQALHLQKPRAFFFFCKSHFKKSFNWTQKMCNGSIQSLGKIRPMSEGGQLVCFKLLRGQELTEDTAPLLL